MLCFIPFARFSKCLQNKYPHHCKNNQLIYLLDSNNTVMYLSCVLLISFLAGIICLSGKDTYQTSPYCYQKKCPKYKLIYDGSSYDVICYQNAQWVETKTNPENGVFGDISESNYIVGKK